MIQELLINTNFSENRVAIVEDRTLSEIYIEHQNRRGSVGNIYLGTVVRVLAGMQACFVDIGQDRTAFLHIDDMQKQSSTSVTATKPQKPIEQQVYEGLRILVQVIKDPLGSKGARLTTNISLPSRYLVYLPFGENNAISSRIDGEERERLKQSLSQISHQVKLQGGLIARTAAENISYQKLEADVYYLLQLWKTVQARRLNVNKKHKFALIYQDLSLPLRAIRDFFGENTERVLIDNLQVFTEVQCFCKEFMPQILPKLHLYQDKTPLFDLYQVENALKNALNRRVDLQSGGYLMIDQTEAMTTIDVNTGSFVSGRSQEETIYTTNLEATHAIAHQLRLRNLGGIIILDFIDMTEQIHRDNVLENLKQQLKKDYAKTSLSEFSSLGLVEMTRKRTRESLQQKLCKPCSSCEGKGFVKSSKTLCFEIFRELIHSVKCAEEKASHAPKKITVVAHDTIIHWLKTSEADTIAQLADLLERKIDWVGDNCYNQEQYNILLE
ncbi:ribonuclease [Moraxella macacae 0408225]|uniref:Ribonuclease n=1 Tax=Moraxella macacae 0408225 TaxID=1230338 RepID=L2F9E4_9GAMM|nr:Rne/Rng family ribonuclease [Moraxella macacae]ELA09396.1 ribonuclease [Moraxella macacae 0408225]